MAPIILTKDYKGDHVRDQYAMKIMKKRWLFERRAIESVKHESKILSSIIHPFVINMKYAF